MDKGTYCAGGPEENGSEAEHEKHGRNRIAEGKLPLCAEVCSTRALLAGDGEVIGDIYRERVVARGFGSGAWGWNTAYYPEESTLPEGWGTPSDATAEILRPSERIEGVSSRPYVRAALFERPDARDWRFGMTDVITHLGALLMLGAVFLLALMLALRGRVPIRSGESGRTVRRFGFVERANHWMTALSFLGLASTGVAIGDGDTLIRPFGATLVGIVGWWATWGHVLFGPSFILGLPVMLTLCTHRNIPSRIDWEWLRRGGGFFSDTGEPPHARKFNAGQKSIFWSAILGGAVMIGTGAMLMFPFFWSEIQTVGWAMLIHAGVAALLIAIFLGHICIGTVGMQGAIRAMWGGDVDRNWAAEHHDLWLEELERKGTAR